MSPIRPITYTFHPQRPLSRTAGLRPAATPHTRQRSTFQRIQQRAASWTAVALRRSLGTYAYYLQLKLTYPPRGNRFRPHRTFPTYQGPSPLQELPILRARRQLYPGEAIAPLKLPMQAAAEYGDRPAVLVEGGVGDELIVHGEVDGFPDVAVVVGLDDFFPAVV